MTWFLLALVVASVAMHARTAWLLGREQAARVVAEKERDGWRSAWFAADEARWHFIMRLDEAEGCARVVTHKLDTSGPSQLMRTPFRAGVR